MSTQFNRFVLGLFIPSTFLLVASVYLPDANIATAPEVFQQTLDELTAEICRLRSLTGQQAAGARMIVCMDANVELPGEAKAIIHTGEEFYMTGRGVCGREEFVQEGVEE